MKKQLSLVGIFVILFSILCFSQNKTKKDDSIKITGTAFNAKAGAVVKNEEGNIYYIEEISSWNDTVVNKKVEVKGILKKEVFRQEDLKNEKGEWIQGMTGEKLTITKPAWKLTIQGIKKPK